MKFKVIIIGTISFFSSILLNLFFTFNISKTTLYNVMSTSIVAVITFSSIIIMFILNIIENNIKINLNKSKNEFKNSIINEYKINIKNHEIIKGLNKLLIKSNIKTIKDIFQLTINNCLSLVEIWITSETNKNIDKDILVFFRKIKYKTMSSWVSFYDQNNKYLKIKNMLVEIVLLTTILIPILLFGLLFFTITNYITIKVVGYELNITYAVFYVIFFYQVLYFLYIILVLKKSFEIY